jgi:membrane protease YdiL (CAAX protease family)
MTSAGVPSLQSVPTYPPAWYPDPWGIGPLRWWDGAQWTPILYGPYGEAWPIAMVPPAPFVPKGPGIMGGGIAAVGAGVGVGGTIAVAVAFLAASSGHLSASDPWYLLASQLALWTGFIGAAIVASRRHGTRHLTTDYGLSLPRLSDLWTGVAGGIIGRVLPTLLVVLVVLAQGGFGTTDATAPKVLGTTPTGTTDWVVVILLAVVGAPLIEELFFRGLVQGALTRRVGAIPAIFITALIFSVAHVTNEGVFAPIVLFPTALILGFLRHRSGRLAPGMIAHATFNASLFLLFLVPAFR